jgi:hypothetical protein
MYASVALHSFTTLATPDQHPLERRNRNTTLFTPRLQPNIPSKTISTSHSHIESVSPPLCIALPQNIKTTKTLFNRINNGRLRMQTVHNTFFIRKNKSQRSKTSFLTTATQAKAFATLPPSASPIQNTLQRRHEA